MQLPKQANQGKQEYKQLMIVSDYLSKKKKKKNKKTTNYRPRSQDSFQNKLLKGNQKAIQQHFSQSLVQNLGKYLPLLA